MLARAGLRDDPLFSHALREQPLRERVVDLVRAGVVEVFTLEPHGRADAVGPAWRIAERRRPSRVVAERTIERGGEGRVGHCVRVRLGERVERGDERFGHVPSAECAEPIRDHVTHSHRVPSCAASMNARIFA